MQPLPLGGLSHSDFNIFLKAIIRANTLAALPLWQDISFLQQVYELGAPILWGGAETWEPLPRLFP